MIEKSTFTFLAKLKKNNNKGWFDANKPAYQAALKNFTEFTSELISRIAEFLW